MKRVSCMIAAGAVIRIPHIRVNAVIRKNGGKKLNYLHKRLD